MVRAGAREATAQLVQQGRLPSAIGRSEGVFNKCLNHRGRRVRDPTFEFMSPPVSRIRSFARSRCWQKKMDWLLLKSCANYFCAGSLPIVATEILANGKRSTRP